MRRFLAIGVVCAGRDGAALDPCAGVVVRDFEAVRVADLLQLQWAAVADSTEYRVYAYSPTLEFQNPVATVTNSQVAFSGTDRYGALDFEVRPLVARRLCRQSRLHVPAVPILQADVDEAGVHLSWTAEAGMSALVGRGQGPNIDAISVLSTATGSTYSDDSVANGTEYTYGVRASAPGVTEFSNTVRVTTLLGAPAVTALPFVTGVSLQWTGSGNAEVTMIAPEPGPAHYNGDCRNARHLLLGCDDAAVDADVVRSRLLRDRR
jgi:hypothetical protein